MQAKNEEFSASDLLFEEYVKSGYLDNSQLPEIQIVKPFEGNVTRNENINQNSEINVGNTMDIVIADEPESPVEQVNNHSSLEYETAGGDDSEASIDSDIEPASQTGYRTLSGRIVTPPQRYG